MDMTEALLTPRSYPRIPLMPRGCAPINPAEKACREQLSGAGITMSTFEPAAMTVKGDPRYGMASCLRHRGDVLPKDMHASVATIKTKIISSLKASVRVNGALRVDMTEAQMALVSYPRTSLLPSSHAPTGEKPARRPRWRGPRGSCPELKK